VHACVALVRTLRRGLPVKLHVLQACGTVRTLKPAVASWHALAVSQLRAASRIAPSRASAKKGAVPPGRAGAASGDVDVDVDDAAGAGGAMRVEEVAEKVLFDDAFWEALDADLAAVS